MSNIEEVISILSKFWESDVKQIPVSVGFWLSKTDPFIVSICFALLLGLYIFIGFLNTGDCSYIDRQWSIVPILHSLIFAYFSNFNTRNILMSILVAMWGVRLTYNFWRQGGYSGVEDYRWGILRQQPIIGNKFIWALFNLGFICIFKEILFVGFVFPAYYVTQVGLYTPLNQIDFLATAIFLISMILVTIADQQQWEFQNEQKKRIQENQGLVGDYKRGFLTSGLFKYSRHPNYFGQQYLWFSFYLFSVAAGGPVLNWSLTGSIALLLLFQGSIQFTEEISSSKYPEYQIYQCQTSRFCLMPGKPMEIGLESQPLKARQPSEISLKKEEKVKGYVN